MTSNVSAANEAHINLVFLAGQPLLLTAGVTLSASTSHAVMLGTGGASTSSVMELVLT